MDFSRGIWLYRGGPKLESLRQPIGPRKIVVLLSLNNNSTAHSPQEGKIVVVSLTSTAYYSPQEDDEKGKKVKEKGLSRLQPAGRPQVPKAKAPSHQTPPHPSPYPSLRINPPAPSSLTLASAARFQPPRLQTSARLPVSISAARALRSVPGRICPVFLISSRACVLVAGERKGTERIWRRRYRASGPGCSSSQRPPRPSCTSSSASSRRR